MKRTKTPVRFAKFKKVFDTFGEGMEDIIVCKPQLSRYILPEKYQKDKDAIKDMTMQEFAENFPNVISAKNPLAMDEEGRLPNRLWEYHLSSHKFHIKTNAYFSLGMNYARSNAEGKDSYCFYITLFGKYDLDRAYLLDCGWEETETSEDNKEDK